MGGRGGGRGGRGGGGGMSFKMEGLLGVGETAPSPCSQPPPAYPPLEHHPSPLLYSQLALTQLSLKIDFLNHFSREVKNLNYPWEFFPAELRPGSRKRKASEKPKSSTKSSKYPSVTIDQLLADLEKTESAQVKVEAEEGDEEEDKEAGAGGGGRGGGDRGDGGGGEPGAEEDFEAEESDEEMDDGTDYNQNYFDNGEGYLDEDDDLDGDGPVY